MPADRLSDIYLTFHLALARLLRPGTCQLEQMAWHPRLRKRCEQDDQPSPKHRLQGSMFSHISATNAMACNYRLLDEREAVARFPPYKKFIADQVPCEMSKRPVQRNESGRHFHLPYLTIFLVLSFG